ncbi:hypothetical protein NC651_023857 [Populus alba x Populus x berolinensis]|nr:hypothetical protein NC651_023857 [Populus alba x Populus x berolinensis]
MVKREKTLFLTFEASDESVLLKNRKRKLIRQGIWIPEATNAENQRDLRLAQLLVASLPRRQARREQRSLDDA